MAQEFTVHRLNALGLSVAEEIAKIFQSALDDLDLLVPQGRERALVVTKLQEACFFAKRAACSSSANQELH